MTSKNKNTGKKNIKEVSFEEEEIEENEEKHEEREEQEDDEKEEKEIKKRRYRPKNCKYWRSKFKNTKYTIFIKRITYNELYLY